MTRESQPPIELDFRRNYRRPEFDLGTGRIVLSASARYVIDELDASISAYDGYPEVQESILSEHLPGANL